MNDKLCAVRAKARVWRVSAPSLKAGVNERQFVDDSVTLVPKSSSHYPTFGLRFVMDGTCMAAVVLLFINPSL